MRKSLLLIAAVFISTLAFAQIQKGDIQLTGTFNLTKTDAGNSVETSGFQFSPRAGLFLNDHTSIGIALGYSSNKQEANTNEQKVGLFTFGAYARFYKPVVDKLYFFLEPSVTLGSGTVKTTGNPDIDTNTFAIALQPGINYFLSDKLALEATVGRLFYSRNKAEGSGNSTEQDSYGLDFSPSNISFGISFFLRK